MKDTILWLESPSQLLNIHKYIFTTIITIIIIYLLNNNINIIYDINLINNAISLVEFNEIVVNITFAIIIVSLSYMTYIFLDLLLTTYTLTNERLIIRKGILIRKRDYTDLYRIIDYGDKANFMEQIFKLDTIIIYTTDKKKPTLIMKGMKNASNKISSIRNNVEKLRLERNVFEIN